MAFILTIVSEHGSSTDVDIDLFSDVAELAQKVEEALREANEEDKESTEPHEPESPF